MECGGLPLLCGAGYRRHRMAGRSSRMP